MIHWVPMKLPAWPCSYWRKRQCYLLHDDTKPLPEPGLINHQWGSVAFLYYNVFWNPTLEITATSPMAQWVHYLSLHVLLYTFQIVSDTMLASASEFAQSTSAHGFSRIAANRSPFYRGFWSVLCLTALILLVMQLVEVGTTYYEYNTHVVIGVSEAGVPFPAVTICNQRAMDFYTTAEILFDENSNPRWTFGDFSYTGRPNPSVYETAVIRYANILAVYKSVVQSLWGPVLPPEVETFQKKLWSRLVMLSNLRYGVASGGTQASEFILECRYVDQECSWMNFTRVIDPAYFNCFVFDPAKSEHALPPGGPSNGLNLMLFLPPITSLNLSNDALKTMAMSQDLSFGGEGVRVTLHEQDSRVLSIFNGIDTPRGTSASFGVAATRHIRMSNPHGNCSQEPNYDVPEGYKHSYALCQHMCLQKAIMKQCGCVDFTLPYDHSHNVSTCQDFGFIPQQCQTMDRSNSSHLQLCTSPLMDWSRRIQCVDDVHVTSAAVPSFASNCGCVPMCEQFSYSVTPSFSDWPVYEQAYQIVNVLLSSHNFQQRFAPKKYETYFENATAETLTWDQARRHADDKSLLRLGIYIQESSLTRVQELAAMTPVDAVSSIGGQLGLWVGMSLLSLMEIAEFLLRTVGKLCRTLCYNEQPVNKETVDEPSKTETRI